MNVPSEYSEESSIERDEDITKFINFLDSLDEVNFDSEKMDSIIRTFAREFKVIKNDEFISETEDNQQDLGGVELQFNDDKFRRVLITSLTFNFDDSNLVYTHVEYVSFDYNNSDAIGFYIDKEQALKYVKKFGFTDVKLYNDNDDSDSEEYQPGFKCGYDFDEMYNMVGG